MMRTLTILALLVSLCWAKTLETEGSEGTASFEAEGSEERGGGTVEPSTIKSWIDPETGINHFTGINEYGKEYQGEWFNPSAPFYFKNGTRMSEADLENMNLFESESESGGAGGDDGTEWFIPPALFHLKNGTSVTWADLEKAGVDAEKFEEGLKPVDKRKGKKAGEKTREPSNKSLKLTPADRSKGRKAKGRR